jgi:hypothetical protein
LVAQVVCNDVQLAVLDTLSELVIQPGPPVWLASEWLFVPRRANRNNWLLESQEESRKRGRSRRYESIELVEISAVPIYKLVDDSRR